MPTSALLLIDTGADSTVLPMYNARVLGLTDSDLRSDMCGVAGGWKQFQRLKDVSETEIEIDGRWLPVPTLTFAEEILHPILVLLCQ